MVLCVFQRICPFHLSYPICGHGAVNNNPLLSASCVGMVVMCLFSFLMSVVCISPPLPSSFPSTLFLPPFLPLSLLFSFPLSLPLSLSPLFGSYASLTRSLSVLLRFSETVCCLFILCIHFLFSSPLISVQFLLFLLFCLL